MGRYRQLPCFEDNRIENQSAANRVSFAPKAANAGRIAKLEKSGHALEWSLSSTIVKPTAQKAAADFVGPLPAFRAEQTALNAEAEAVIEPEEAAAEKQTMDLCCVMRVNHCPIRISMRFTRAIPR